MPVLALPLRVFLILSLAQLVICVDRYPVANQFCVIACQEAFSNQTFTGKGKAADEQRCENELFVESMALCAAKYCSSAELSTGSRFADVICEEADFEKPSILAVVTSFLPGQANQTKTLVTSGKKSTLNATVVPDERLFRLALRSVASRGRNRQNNARYSNAIYIFWGIILGFGTLHNALARVPAASRPYWLNRLWNKLRAIFILPATSSNLYLASLGTPVETLTLMTYVMLSIILCAVNIEAYRPSMYYKTFPLQVYGLTGRRVATLALTNIPIVWLFGIRNNILIYLTGWEYTTFSRFHRWIARLTVLELLVHAICFTGFEFEKGKSARYLSMWAESWWSMGVTALVILSFILLCSTFWLRKHYYDVFLLVHIVLALVALISLYFHLEMWHGIFTPYLWAIVGIWVFDRVARLTRILLSSTFSKTTVEHDAAANLLRVDVTQAFAKSRLRPIPGAYYYIYTPTRLHGWESHPFTLTASPPPAPHHPSTTPTPSHEKPSAQTTTALDPPSSSNSSTTSPSPPTTYTFLIRPHHGFTARLTPPPSNTPLACATSHILLEGPYGACTGALRPPLHRYASVLLVCGGSGISVGVASVYNVLRQTRRAGVTVPAVKLVWAVREAGLLKSVVARELAGVVGGGEVAVEAYVTGAGGEGEGKGEKGGVDGIVRRYGRPDVAAVVREAALAVGGEETKGGGSAVVACGPLQLMQDVREAGVGEVKAGRNVDVFIEEFGW